MNFKFDGKAIADITSVNTALHLSIGVTSFALLIFGAVKGKFTAISPLKVL
jgi:VIT1/CCC1 family predicted Fe2+/Mn2+ transporter